MPSLPSLLATGRVDGIGQFTVGQPLLAAAVKPKKLVRFAYKDAGLDYYGNGIIATEQTIKEDPELLKGFIRATLKGMRDAFADPAAAGEIMHKYHKEVSAEVAEGETEKVRELAEVSGQTIGVIEEARIQRTIEVMQKAYPMKQPVKPQDMFVPGFVE